MSTFKQTSQKADELSRKIWLAGLGAYGKNLTAAQLSVSGSVTKTQSVFESLVARGEKVEAEAKAQLESNKAKLKEAAESVQKKSDRALNKSKETFESRIQISNVKKRISKLRGKISDNVSSSEACVKDYITQANKRIEEITEKVNSLIKA